MKVLVTGVNGQLGFDCVREVKNRGNYQIIAIDKNELDITNEGKVHAFIEKLKPDVIMHNAAWTSVDAAENNKDLVMKVNADAVGYIAEAAEKINAKLVYISTDYVFPGTGNQFYEINDFKNPINVYGESKLRGEKMAKKCSRLFIVRISWVFGINGNNFVKTMIKLAETHNELSIVSDQIGSPTYTKDLAKLLCDMIETEKYGIYHATNEGVCSWSDFARAIFEYANKKVIVNSLTTEEYQKIKVNQAKRPLNSRLSKKSLDDSGFARLPHWRNALKRFLKELEL